MQMSDQDTGWHLDKRVPIALVVTILIQTGGAVWWLSSINSRVSNLEEKVGAVSSQPERLVRLETQMDAMRDSMLRIERKLDRLIDLPGQ
jgi:Tfp pilus assembly protein PilO